jgi:hypothetical protein
VTDPVLVCALVDPAAIGSRQVRDVTDPELSRRKLVQQLVGSAMQPVGRVLVVRHKSLGLKRADLIAYSCECLRAPALIAGF